MNGTKLRFRRWLAGHVPAGIATGPFEFAVALGYLAASLRILTDATVYRQVELLLFPGGGFLAWLTLLIGSCAMIVTGQVISAHLVLLGLRLERFGLLALSAALAGYLYAVWARSAGISVAVETVGATLLACLYKAATINTALEGVRAHRKGRTHEDD